MIALGQKAKLAQARGCSAESARTRTVDFGGKRALVGLFFAHATFGKTRIGALVKGKCGALRIAKAGALARVERRVEKVRQISAEKVDVLGINQALLRD